MGNIEEIVWYYESRGIMSREIIEYRKQCLYLDDVFFLVSKCIPKDYVDRCVRTLGIIFPGVRAKNISQEDMAEALAEEFFNKYEVAEAVTSLLDEHIPRLELPIPETDEQIKKFKKQIKISPPEKVFCYVWKLSGIQSNAARMCLDAIHKFFKRKFDSMDEEIEQDTIDDLMKLPAKVSSLEDELKASQQRIHKQEKYIHELEQKNNENIVKLQKSKDTIYNDDKKIKALEEEIGHVRQKMKELDTSPELKSQLTDSCQKIESLQDELKMVKDKLSSWKNLKRVGLFIDVQNLISCARQEYRGALDFESLWKKVSFKGLHSSYRLITEAYAYLAEDPAQEKIGLKNNMKKVGLNVRTRPIMFRADGTAKGDWDLGMTIEVLERADRLDIVVLGTGDGDFLDLVQYLKKTKPFIEVELVCFQSPHYTSERLLKAVDHVHYMGTHDILPFNKQAADS